MSYDTVSATRPWGAPWLSHSQRYQGEGFGGGEVAVGGVAEWLTMGADRGAVSRDGATVGEDGEALGLVRVGGEQIGFAGRLGRLPRVNWLMLVWLPSQASVRSSARAGLSPAKTV